MPQLLLAISMIVFAVAVIATSIYGLILAFSASILLGIFTLILEPLPFLFGLAMLLFEKNIPEYIMQFLNS